MSAIKNKIKQINEYVQQFKWLDFAYDNISEEKISIIGGLDLSWKDTCIDIVFEQPINMLTILTEWHRNDDKPFIEIATRAEAIDTIKYIGDENYFVFKINADGYDIAPIWIAAKSISFNTKTIK